MERLSIFFKPKNTHIESRSLSQYVCSHQRVILACFSAVWLAVLSPALSLIPGGVLCRVLYVTVWYSQLSWYPVLLCVNGHLSPYPGSGSCVRLLEG